jgi:hypothetical protein
MTVKSETKMGTNLEEELTSICQDDTLASAAYYEAFCREISLRPEKKLMLAVLEDGVLCFQNYMFARDGRGEVLFRKAENWILEENSDWLFSFENICEALGLNPGYVRQRLLHWKDVKLAERLPSKAYLMAKGTPRITEETTKS